MASNSCTALRKRSGRRERTCSCSARRHRISVQRRVIVPDGYHETSDLAIASNVTDALDVTAHSLNAKQSDEAANQRYRHRLA